MAQDSIHISCPACDTVFRMPATEFDETGRELRCSICSHEWLATEDDVVIPSDTIEEITEDEMAGDVNHSANAKISCGTSRKGRCIGWLCNLLLLSIIGTIAVSYLLQRNYPFVAKQDGNQLTVINTSDSDKKLCGVYADTYTENTLASREWVKVNQSFAAGEERVITLDNVTNQTIKSGNCMYLMLTGIWQKFEGLFRD